uniref:Uncharacterized protein n=1 Tax=Aegilops tauschii subsp. strangulata TaxID=200361 RepID=A0A453QL65_AEGTS
GSVSLKLPASRRRHGGPLSCLCSPAPLNLLMLLSLLCTNLLAFFAFFAAPTRHDPAAGTTPSSSANLSAHVAAIALEIGDGASSSGGRLPDGLPPELLLFLTPHALPLGRDARTGLTHMPASVAASCLRSPSALALLSAFMSYAPHSACPRNATLPRRQLRRPDEGARGHRRHLRARRAREADERVRGVKGPVPAPALAGAPVPLLRRGVRPGARRHRGAGRGRGARDGAGGDAGGAGVLHVRRRPGAARRRAALDRQLPVPERGEEAGGCQADREVWLQEAQVGRRREGRRCGDINLPLRGAAKAGKELKSYTRIDQSRLLDQRYGHCALKLFVAPRF